MARRWARWASNLLMSGIVIVLGLVFGRELVQWWRDPDGSGAVPNVAAERSTGVAPLPSNSANALHDLAFGDLPMAVRHGTVGGTEVNVLAELRRQCAAAAQAGTGPTRPQGEAEQRMIAGLMRQRAVERSGQDWELYELPRPLPMVAVVSGSSQTVAAERRVLSWGIALPHAGGADEMPHWNWFAWRTWPAGDAGRADSSSWPQPPGSHRVMSLASPDGSAMAAFAGADRVENWREACDHWMHAQAATAASGWQTQHGQHQRTYERPNVGRYVVQIMELPHGALRGIVLRSPAVSQASSGEAREKE